MINRCFQNGIRYRYVIACLVIFLGVALNLNGSSIASWNRMGVTEMQDGTQSISRVEGDETAWLSTFSNNDGVILGIPRGIRSDEWMVQTPYFLSQINQGSPLFNKNYGLSSQNMMVAYNSPIRHISIIGKPFNWGALFLSSSRALSWYWMFKIVTFILLAFEFLMIITNKNKILSLVCSLFMTYTPAIQWWFMQHLGDVVWYTLLSLVSIYYYFNTYKIQSKVLFAFLFSISLIGFTLVIYPAFQVVFAYIILFYFFTHLLRTIKQKRFVKADWIMMLITAIITFVIIGISIYNSFDAISTSLRTVYPGRRISVGGELSLDIIGTFVLNPFLPFKVPTILNQVELATSMSFLPLFLVGFGTIFIKWEFVKKHIFIIFLYLYTLFLYAYVFLGIPEWFAKITLLSYVTSSRAWQALSVIGVILSVWFINYMWEMNNRKLRNFFLVVSGISFLFLTFLTLKTNIYQTYVSRKWMLLILVLFLFTYLSGVLKFKKIFVSLILLWTIVTGMSINPVVQGTDVIEKKKLSLAIKEIVEQDREAIWMTDNNMLYNFPQMFGARMINGVRFYPDIKEMNIIDEDNHFKENWNRYAHIRPTIIKEGLTMSNSSPDVLNLEVSQEVIEKLQVSYVISNRDLSKEISNDFILRYGPDNDGNRIYQYNQKIE